MICFPPPSTSSMSMPDTQLFPELMRLSEEEVKTGISYHFLIYVRIHLFLRKEKG